MENKYKTLLRKEDAWAGVKSFSLEQARGNKDLCDLGELKGLKVSLVPGETIEFDDAEHVGLFPREFKSGSKALYISCIRNGSYVDHLPVAIFRRKPAGKYVEYDAEAAKLGRDVNPVGAQLLDNAVCLNDLDRVALLCKLGKITVKAKVKIHLQSFDGEGKPKDGEFYEQDCWTFE